MNPRSCAGPEHNAAWSTTTSSETKKECERGAKQVFLSPVISEFEEQMARANMHSLQWPLVASREHREQEDADAEHELQDRSHFGSR